MREYLFWLDEAQRTLASEQLDAAAAASVPYLDPEDRRPMLERLQHMAMTQEQRAAADAKREAGYEASRARIMQRFGG